MDDATVFALIVLLGAAALVAAIAANSLGSRIRVPAPALFLVVAAVAATVFPRLGSLSLMLDQRIVSVALIFILFDGGMHIGWREFRSAAGAIAWIGVAGTALTAAAIAVFAHLVLGFGWQGALLLGAALAPTDPAVVFAVLGKRDIEGRSGTILEGESGLNDPVGIALLGTLIAAGAAGNPVGDGLVEFLLQMVIGIAVGVGGGLLLRLLMRRVRLPNEALYPLRAIAFAALIYGAGTVLGGSGFLAVFLAGIIVGDQRAPYQTEIRRFSSGLSSLAEFLAFTVLGLTVSWTQVLQPAILLPGLLVAVLLIAVVRPVLVGLISLPIRLRLGERAFVMLAGLKGAVPILLGIVIRDADVPGGEQIASLIFVVVLVSVVVQGGLVPQLASWLRVPMRVVQQQPFAAGLRFEEEPEDLRRFVVGAGSAAEHITVGHLSLGEHGWVSLVKRDGRSVRLTGGTRLRAGDEVLAFTDPDLDVADLFVTRAV